MTLTLELDRSELEKFIFNGIFLDLLLFLSQQEEMKASASQLAELTGVHISTAMKYLNIMYALSLVEKNTATGLPGNPTYYILKKLTINLKLDLNRLAKEITPDQSIGQVFIKEKKRDPRYVDYKIGLDGMVSEIRIAKRTKTRRIISQTVQLSELEQQLFHLVPHPSMEPKKLEDLMQEMGNLSFFSKRNLEIFVKKLGDKGIIEIIEE